MLCYSRLSELGVLPDTDVELRLCFSLRADAHSTLDTLSYFGVVFHIVIVAVRHIALLYVVGW